MSAPTSSAASRRAFLIGSVLAAGAAVALAAKPRHSEDRLLRHNLADLIPRTIGPWAVTTMAGMIVATEDQAAPAEGYDQLLTRVYRADGLPTIMLLLAYGSTQGGSLQLHRPETCYPGQGFRLDAFSDVDLDVGIGNPVHARRFTARRDDRVERLTYWTRISDRFPTNTAEEYASIIASVARGSVPDGLLVRASSLEGDQRGIDAALAQFVRAMVLGSGPAGRNLLVGDARGAVRSQTA
jgi:EpsI family protein